MCLKVWTGGPLHVLVLPGPSHVLVLPYTQDLLAAKKEQWEIYTSEGREIFPTSHEAEILVITWPMCLQAWTKGPELKLWICFFFVLNFRCLTDVVQRIEYVVSWFHRILFVFRLDISKLSMQALSYALLSGFINYLQIPSNLSSLQSEPRPIVVCRDSKLCSLPISQQYSLLTHWCPLQTQFQPNNNKS